MSSSVPAPIALLAPMASELKPLERAAGRTLATGPAYLTRQIGVGTAAARRATEALLAGSGVRHVVVVGIAGGVDRSLQIGDLFVPEVVVDEAAGSEHRPAPLPGLAPKGRLFTTDVLHSLDELDTLIAAGVDALDMETAAVAQVCEVAGVPWSVVRAISDRVEDGLLGEDVMGMLNVDGSTNVRAALKALVRRPRRVLQLSQLARDASKAARAAAEAAVTAVRSLPDPGA